MKCMSDIKIKNAEVYDRITQRICAHCPHVKTFWKNCEIKNGNWIYRNLKKDFCEWWCQTMEQMSRRNQALQVSSHSKKGVKKVCVQSSNLKSFLTLYGSIYLIFFFIQYFKLFFIYPPLVNRRKKPLTPKPPDSQGVLWLLT